MNRQLRLYVPARHLVFPGQAWPRVEINPLAPGIPVRPIGDHRHDADQVDYSTASDSAIATVKDALDKLLFVQLGVALSGGSVRELGSSVASVALAWTINKGISAQVLAGPGVGSILTTDRAAVATGPFAVDTAWSLTATSADGSEVRAGATSLAFRSRRWWGVSASPTLDDAGVLGLAGSELATARQQTRTLDATGGRFLWFAWPADFGAPAFWVGGLLNTAWIETLRDHVNAYGYSRPYRLYRSQFLQNGSGIGVEVR